MGERIASLFVEIGSDHSKLDKGLKDVKGKLQGTTTEMGKNQTATQKMQGSWKSFATTAGLVAGGAYAAYRSLKQVYELGKEGAALDYQAGKFDRLTTSIGSTSDALMRDLRAATKGTRSDMELMAGAGDLMSLGLAKSHEEVVRLSRVVGGLGMDMNELVLTLTNQTTRRFDQLGVSVDGFDAKVKALEDTGMSAKDAFNEAFLQQAEEQLARVGDIADTDAGKIARMEAATKNLGDAFKLWLAPGVADAAEAMADLLTHNQAALDMFGSERDKLKTTTQTYDDYTKAIIKAGIESEAYSKIQLADHVHTLMLLDESYQGVVPSISKLNEKTEEELIVLAKERDYLDQIIVALGGYSSQTWEAANSMDYADRIARNMGDGMGEASGDADDLADSLDDVSDAAGTAKDKILGLNDIDLNLSGSIKTELDKIEFYLAGGLDLQAVTDSIIEAVEKGTITPEQGQALLNEAFVAAEALQVDMDNITADEAAQNVSSTLGLSLTDAKQLVLDTQTELDNIPSDIYVTLHITEVGNTNYPSDTIGARELRANEDLNGNGVIGYATGGSFIIEPGYTETYPVGPNQVASTGERVDITPVGKTGNGKEIVINLYNANFIDQVEMESQVYHMVQEALRRGM